MFFLHGTMKPPLEKWILDTAMGEPTQFSGRFFYNQPIN